MKTLKYILLAGALVAASHWSSAPLLAQPAQGWANMDPQQIRQEIQRRAAEFFRDRLVVTNDDEWKVIEPRLTKVVQAKAQHLLSPGMGGFRLPQRMGNGDNPMLNTIRTFLGLDQTSPESEALDKAIEAHASNAELRTAVSKVLEARKRKQAETEKAQTELRKVLSLRQEATLLLLGVLD
jgi:hypothetical protein